MTPMDLVKCPVILSWKVSVSGSGVMNGSVSNAGGLERNLNNSMELSTQVERFRTLLQMGAI